MSQRFHSPHLDDAVRPVHRREFLRRCGLGLGSLAAASLLEGPNTCAGGTGELRPEPLSPQPPHFPPRVRRVVHFFPNGGASQVDTFDPKPALERYAGKPVPTGNLATENVTTGAFPSPFRLNSAKFCRLLW